MGQYKEEHGVSRIGAALQKIGDVGKPILELLSKAPIPGAELLGSVANAIRTSTEISEEQKQQLLSLIQMDLADLDSARQSNRDIQNSQFSSWAAKNGPYIIDGVVTFTWLFMTLFILVQIMKVILQGTELQDLTVIMTLYTAVSIKFEQVLSFHRGSSSGSRMKDFIKTNQK